MVIDRCKFAALGVGCAAFLGHVGDALAANGEATEPPQMLSDIEYWSAGRTRPFASARLEGGLLYLKPQAAIGYGKPYWMWGGLEAYAITTNSFGGGYVGVRAALPFVNLSVGIRRSYSYIRSFLPPQDHYTADDVSRARGAHALYSTWENELSCVAPVPGGYAFVVPGLYYVADVPDGSFVYEESLRAVAKPPYLWAVRAAYLLTFGPAESVKLGGLTEIVGLPGRDEAILRAGPVANVTFTHHLDLIGTFSAVIMSPDSLGLWHGPLGLVGLRWYHATGEDGQSNGVAPNQD